MTDVYQSIALNLFGEDLVKAFVSNSIKVSGSVGSVNIGSFENGLDGTSFHVNIIVELLKDSILTISSLKEDAAFVDATSYSNDVKMKFPVKVPLLSVFSSKNVSIDGMDATSFSFCKKGDKDEWIFSEIPSGTCKISISYTYVDVVSVLGTQRTSAFGDNFPSEYISTPGFYIQDTYKTKEIKLGENVALKNGSGHSADELNITSLLPGGNRSSEETYTITAALGSVIHDAAISQAVSAEVAKLNKKDYYNVSYVKNSGSENDKNSLTGSVSIINTSVPVSEEGIVNLDWSIQTKGKAKNVTGTPRQGNVRWSKAVVLTASPSSVERSRDVKTWWGLFSGWHYRTDRWTEYYYRGDSSVSVANSNAASDFDLGSRYLDSFTTDADYAHNICTVTPLPLILLLTKPTESSQSLKNFNAGKTTYVDSEKLHLDGMNNVVFQRVVVLQSAVEGVTVSGTIYDNIKQYTVSSLGIQRLSTESTCAKVNLTVNYYGHPLCTISHTYSLENTSSINIDLLQSVVSNILEIPHCVQGKLNVVKKDGQKQLITDYSVISGTDARYSLTEEILLEKGSSGVSKIGTSQILTAEEVSVLDAVNGYYECNTDAVEASIAKVKNAIDIKCNYECKCDTGYYTKLNDSSTKINWTFKSLSENVGYHSIESSAFISNVKLPEVTSPDSFSPTETKKQYWCQIYSCRFTSASEDKAYIFYYHKKIGVSFSSDKGFSFTENPTPAMTDADKAYLLELSKLKCNLKVNDEVESSVSTEAVIEQEGDQLLLTFAAQDMQLGREEAKGSYVLTATPVSVGDLKEEVTKRGYLLMNPGKTETDYNKLSDTNKQSAFEALSVSDMRDILDDMMLCYNDYSRGYIKNTFKWSGLGDIDESSITKSLTDGASVKVYKDNSAIVTEGVVHKRSSAITVENPVDTQYSVDSLPEDLQDVIKGSNLSTLLVDSYTTYRNENKPLNGYIFNTIQGYKLTWKSSESPIAVNRSSGLAHTLELMKADDTLVGTVTVYQRTTQDSTTWYASDDGGLDTLKNLLTKFVYGNSLLYNIGEAVGNPTSNGLVTATSITSVHTVASKSLRSYESVKNNRKEITPERLDFYVSSKATGEELIDSLLYLTKVNLYTKVEPLTKTENTAMKFKASDLSQIQDSISTTNSRDNITNLIDTMRSVVTFDNKTGYSLFNTLEVCHTDLSSKLTQEMLVGSYEYPTVSFRDTSNLHVGKEGATITLESNLEGLNKLNLVGTETKANVLF